MSAAPARLWGQESVSRECTRPYESRNVQLTQHALRLPGVVVPGFDSVLDFFRDAIGGHVFNSVVHARAVVRLACCGGTDHVAHLRDGRTGSALSNE